MPINVKNAQEVHAPRAPVGDPLTGKERAGVSLTWGVLGLIAAFLLVVLIVLGITELDEDRRCCNLNGCQGGISS